MISGGDSLLTSKWKTYLKSSVWIEFAPKTGLQSGPRRLRLWPAGLRPPPQGQFGPQPRGRGRGDRRGRQFRQHRQLRRPKLRAELRQLLQEELLQLPEM